MPLEIVRMWSETEQIEITQDGSFGGPVDTFRQFMPGMTRYFCQYNNGSVVETTEEHCVAWNNNKKVGV